jgi:hypothetical protein
MIDMIKVRISKDGITRSYHLESKTAEWFDSDGTFKGTFDIEGELQGLAEIVNSNIGCKIEMIEQEVMQQFRNSDKNRLGLKEIPVNELAIHKIAKEIKKKLD